MTSKEKMNQLNRLMAIQQMAKEMEQKGSFDAKEEIAEVIEALSDKLFESAELLSDLSDLIRGEEAEDEAEEYGDDDSPLVIIAGPGMPVYFPKEN